MGKVLAREPARGVCLGVQVVACTCWVRGKAGAGEVGAEVDWWRLWIGGGCGLVVALGVLRSCFGCVRGCVHACVLFEGGVYSNVHAVVP